MIKCINEKYGDPIKLNSIEEYESLVKQCGYTLPEDGLREGRDYIDLDSDDQKIEIKSVNE